MSLSSAISDENVIEALDGLVARAAEGRLEPRLLQLILSSATALYARSCEQAGYELVPVNSDVNTTDAVRLSVALARSQQLTPFDLSLWFARPGGTAPVVEHV